ncbi:PilW family protein [Methylomonas sp. LL1]|uniref:PilW family protein n=1 Tax=Methylomonas sp. LL1 TaxID=2785785 RepID=UPI0018C36BCB|nr:PilW family protein [Methylomonas sp. LL1]QPK64184.1 PilW family protein [Methylomonas sp. LL1]
MNLHSINLRKNSGFSLVELMIALLLGLFLIGGVISVFLSNRVAYRQNENLARIQENARYAFEVMGRDIREAGGIACGSNLLTANVLNDKSTTWWANWGDGLQGYEGDETLPAKANGTGATDRVAGTDAVVIHTGTDDNGVTITEHNPASAQFKVNTTAHGIVDGDVLLVCDYKQAAIFQTTNASSTNVTIVHNTGTGTPGNCSKGLGYPTVCTALGTPYTFEGGGLMTKLAANAWYIGFNGRGGRSLYRVSGTPTPVAEEIAEGVTDLQIQYLAKDAGGSLPASYVDADAITDWTRVVATRLVFTIQSLENVGTDAQPLERTWNVVVSLRNRVS